MRRAMHWIAFGLVLWLAALAHATEPTRLGSINDVAISAELKSVKLYGAGGAGLDAFQSGILISDQGHILTVWSTVLDVETIIAVTSDGRRLEASVVGVDPNLEIAVLSTDEPTSHFFKLAEAGSAEVGEWVLAISNLYGIATGNEMSSVQKGVVMARTELRARRGSFESVYQGPVYVIDAMTNNPGAAGGCLTDIQGSLIGLLGKELRDSRANTWLNYAIPITELRQSVARILAGESIQRAASTRPAADRPANLKDLGIALVPNILAKTPAYVDLVVPQSVASLAGVQSDDLILFINSVRISSQAALLEELKYIDRADALMLLIQRGSELKEIVLDP